MVQGYPQKIVEVQVDGVPSGPPSESGPSSPSGETPVKKDSPLPMQYTDTGSRAKVRGRFPCVYPWS